ncbi:ATP-binding protein [Tautonia sp. JC769]|uniref:AAA family ATPase n=1 Tax=Tautonia sp. JC769 TaxID=3232135 RepID=UPI00345AB680
MSDFMYVEILRVKDFAGINDAEIHLSRFNVFIGPQASGKSVCAKLLFFFKESIKRLSLGVAEEQTKPQLCKEDRELFLSYFPPKSWGENAFYIKYECGSFFIEVSRREPSKDKIDISYSDQYHALIQAARRFLKKGRHDEDFFGQYGVLSSVRKKAAADINQILANSNFFIPAGRSFFSTIQSNVFSFLANNLRIDPFLAEFGRLWERYRHIYAHRNYYIGARKGSTPRVVSKELTARVNKIICGSYEIIKGEDFIHTNDGRIVPLNASSSGQQEALPLAITLAGIPVTPDAEHTTFIVEEPEAHLYPSAQREIVHLFAAATDLTSVESCTQYILTTHSPYILSAINNLMYGSNIVSRYPKKAKAVAKVLNHGILIDPTQVRAYLFSDSSIRSIMDSEAGLIDARVLDRVSGDIAREFEELMEIDPEL